MLQDLLVAQHVGGREVFRVEGHGDRLLEGEAVDEANSFTNRLRVI